MTAADGAKSYGTFGGMVVLALLANHKLTNRCVEDLFAPWNSKWHVPAILLIFIVGWFAPSPIRITTWSRRRRGRPVPPHLPSRASSPARGEGSI